KARCRVWQYELSWVAQKPRKEPRKKTFTKWVNKHLIKASKRVDDLFVDLQDGHSLLSLLEVLSGETLPREKGRMRFHMLQNVQTALNFLRYRKIKLVNIRAEDIVDGNPKLTLGLIWTIILHFQGTAHCPNCPEVKADTEHILYACNTALNSPYFPYPSPPSWNAWLSSDSADLQWALAEQALLFTRP
ncbi:hypothetical protein HPB47_027792, partial [Ixodes persulcatus]